MGLSFPQIYPALLRMCSEDTFIEHKKLPPDDFYNNTVFRPYSPVSSHLFHFSHYKFILVLVATTTPEISPRFS